MTLYREWREENSQPVYLGVARGLCEKRGLVRRRCCEQAEIPKCIIQQYYTLGWWNSAYHSDHYGFMRSQLEVIAGGKPIRQIDLVGMCIRLYVWDELIWEHPNGFPSGIESSYDHALRVADSASGCVGEYPCYDDINGCWNVNGEPTADAEGVAYVFYDVDNQPGVFSLPSFWRGTISIADSLSAAMHGHKFRLALLCSFYRYRGRVAPEYVGTGPKRVYGGYDGADVVVVISLIQ